MHGKAARGTLSAIVLFPGMRERCIRLGNHLPSFYSQFIFGTVATHQHRFQLYLCPSSPSATDQSSVAWPGELRFQYATLICRLQIERRYVTLLLFLLFFFFFSFFLFDLNAIPRGSAAYAPTSSSGADSPWRRLCFGLNSPIPFFSFVENVTFFKLVQNCGSLQSNAIEQGTLVLSNKLTAQIMRKIVGDKKPINRLSIGKVLSCD